MTKRAKTYGGALYELCKEEGAVEAVRTDLRAMAQIFRETPEYVSMLASPALSLAEKEAMLDEAWKERVHKYTLNFMKLLCSIDAFSELPECIQHYRSLYNRDNGLAHAKVTSAAPLSDAQMEKLQAALQEKTGKSIDFSVSVDPGLIGGLRVELDGVMYDNSVAYHLGAIKKLLKSDQNS